jgi:DNA-binding CsgD family transcriptional regulator
VLAFVARRISSERVALMYAVEEPLEAFEGLPELILHGVSQFEAHALLTSVFPGPLHERVRDRIVAEARGNLRALFALPYSPVAEPIARSVRSRLEGLTAHTRRLLLIAAADPEGDPVLLSRAATELGIPLGAVDEAEALGLLELGARVAFRHPSMRSVVYDGARFDERRRVHQALADASDPDTDPDRWAWHRGHATLALDEDVAAALERAAGHVPQCGGVAAAFLERSALLTPDPERRARRALAAAHAKFEAGSLEAASELLVAADEGSFDELERARLERLRAKIAVGVRRGADAVPLLLEAAKRLEPLDVPLARDTYLQALEATFFSGHFDGGWPGLADTAEAARTAPRATAPGAADLLLDGLAVLCTDGYVAAAATLRQAVQAFLHADDTRWLGLAAAVAAELWDDQAVLDLVTRWIRLNRETGALRQLPAALSSLVMIHVHAGELASAAAIIDQANAISDATGVERISHSPMVLAAWRGAEARANELMEAGRRDALTGGDGRKFALIDYARAVLDNGLGRYEDALEALQQVGEPDDLFSCWILPELVEAAARSGKPDRAAMAVERLVESTQMSGTEWALGFQARSVALVTQGPGAEKHYRQAIERFGRCAASAHRARAHLIYGEWLRRERRRIDAREQLRIAYEMFSAMGADAFAARAQRELRATGERARRRIVETTTDLTPQEAEIAGLARAGHSNPQIASKLFISARTVEYHLHKVFTKLGIGSRGELAYNLDQDTHALASQY